MPLNKRDYYNKLHELNDRHAEIVKAVRAARYELRDGREVPDCDSLIKTLDTSYRTHWKCYLAKVAEIFPVKDSDTALSPACQKMPEGFIVNISATLAR